MSNWITPADNVSLKRRLYALLLAAGTAGVFAAVLSDARRAFDLHGGPAAVETAAPRAAVGRPLTTGTRMDGFGAWSPDGQRILFMRSGEIWQVEANGTQARAVTAADGSWDAVPSWRPDGKEIAFVRIAAAGDRAQVMAADPATGSARQVYTEREPIGHVAWATDAKGIYYTTARRLMYVDIAKAVARAVWTAHDGWEMLAGGLTLSQDGAFAIFGAGPETTQGTRYDLWTIALGGPGAQPVRLTSGGGIMPALDVASKRVVYRNPREQTGIYLMDLTTHHTQRVIADETKALYFHPDFAPDGRTLVVSRLLLDRSEKLDKRTPFTSHLYLHTLGAAGGR